MRLTHNQFGPITARQFMLLLLASCSTIHVCLGNSYQKAVELFHGNLLSNNYSVEIRPVKDQSNPIRIHINFSLLNIINVDEVTQSLTINGFMRLSWLDEINTWNPADYGNVTLIRPVPQLMWRPRMILSNTLGARDLFANDISTTSVYYTGLSAWYPGSVFPVRCKLDLTKYPFDRQRCNMEMTPMMGTTDELTFETGSPFADRSLYIHNGEWILVDLKISSGAITADSGNYSYVKVHFHIKRRSTYYALNILLPVVLLSFLNLLVFTIPDECGEKISYGISVLLSLSVYLSMVSSLVPRSSDVVPLITVYLSSLFLISMMSVTGAILVVYMLHLELQHETHRGLKEKWEKALKKTTMVATATNQTTKDKTGLIFSSQPRSKEVKEAWGKQKSEASTQTTKTNENGSENPRVDPNHYKILGKRVNWVLFLVLSFIWFVLTAWYFIRVTT